MVLLLETLLQCTNDKLDYARITALVLLRLNYLYVCQRAKNTIAVYLFAKNRRTKSACQQSHQ